MIETYLETRRIDDLYQILSDDIDATTLMALEQLLAKIPRRYNATSNAQLEHYHNEAHKLLIHIKAIVFNDAAAVPNISQAVIDKRITELATQLHFDTVSPFPPPIATVTQQLALVYHWLINHRWLQKQNFPAPAKLTADYCKIFAFKEAAELAPVIKQLLTGYQSKFEEYIKAPNELSNRENVAILSALKDIQTKLAKKSQEIIATEKLPLLISKAFKAYKRENGLVKLLLLINGHNKNNIFEKIKSFIPVESQEAAQTIIYNQSSFNALIQKMLASFAKPQPLKKSILFSPAVLDHLNTENNAYFSKDFSNDYPEQAIADFRRDNHLAKNNYNIKPDENDDSIKTKIFQFAKNPIIAKHLLARGGQAHQAPLLDTITTHLNISYSPRNEEGMIYDSLIAGSASNASTIEFGDNIAQDGEGDYLTMDINFKIYALSHAKSNKYIAMSEDNQFSLEFISEASKIKLGEQIRNRETLNRPPLLQASLKKKLYIDAYAYKQANKYYAMNNNTMSLREIGIEEFNSIKDLLLEGKTPTQSTIPLSMIPAEIVGATDIQSADNLLGKIRVKNLSIAIDEHYAQLNVQYKDQAPKKSNKKTNFIITDGSYHEALRKKLAKLRGEKRALELQPNSVEKQRCIQEKMLEIIDADLESIQIERHHYKTLFHTAHATGENLNPLKNIITLATNQLAEYELKNEQLSIQLALRQTDLKNANQERNSFINKKYGKINPLIADHFVPIFSKTFDLLAQPALHIRKQSKVAPTDEASMLENLIKQTLYVNTKPKYNIAHLDRENLNDFIDNLSRCIAQIDEYLKPEHRSMPNKLSDKIKSTLDKLYQQPTHSNKPDRTKLTVYRDTLINMQNKLVSSEYYQYLNNNQDFTAIKTTDTVLRAIQSELSADRAFTRLNAKVNSLAHSIDKINSTKKDIDNKIAKKYSELAELAKQQEEQTPVNKYAAHSH